MAGQTEVLVPAGGSALVTTLAALGVLVAFGGADALEMTRLPGTEVWTCTWSVPEDWSASYGFAIWKDESVPPWRAMSGRSARLAAMLAAEQAGARIVVVEPSGFVWNTMFTDLGRWIEADPQKRRFRIPPRTARESIYLQ